jgi:beta-lactamase superfamily II metal-dependent hydrolase
MRLAKAARQWANLSLACTLGLAVFAAPVKAWAAKGDLQIYMIDVEGGQSTLFVAPGGHSLLIDTGWPGNAGRDADRIVAATKLAGITKIDTVLLTHYHDDHTGGVPQLVDRIPVGTFIDHGANTETKEGSATLAVAQAYQKVLDTGKYKHIVARPGDVLPIAGMKVTVISSNGDVIDHPVPGGGEMNKFCDIKEDKPQDHSENSRSLGILINFGKIKILDLGDLTWGKERDIMCPVNKLGKIDILVVSHHGFRPSSSHALIDGITPRVALMDNASAKGGNISVLDTIRQTAGIETLWQLHYSDEGGAEHNTAAEYVANPQGPDRGNFFEVNVSPKGSFTIFNSGTKQTKTYPAK